MLINFLKQKPMKKTLIIVLSLISLSLSAQKGFSVGASGGYIGSVFINQNTWGVGYEYDYDGVSTQFIYHINGGYGITESIRINVGVGKLFLEQNYHDNINGNEFTRQLSSNYISIPVTVSYKTGNNHPAYFIIGIGAEFAFSGKFTQDWRKNGEPYLESGINAEGDTFVYGQKDVTNRFNKNTILFICEIGGGFKLVNHLFLDITIVAGYGLTDINASSYRINDASGNYSGTHNAYAGISCGLVYYFN